MAELKTKMTRASVSKFVNATNDEQMRRDCKALLALMKRISGEEPSMWGTSIVGFGSYHYRYDSGREGEWFRIGFSPRKNAISIYVTAGFRGMEDALKRLGKHKRGASCLYIKKLDEVDRSQLTKVLSIGYQKYTH
jgi:Domain of unknown function (DU1801)